MNFLGYLRPDGNIGIRNKILIIAVDECCDGVAHKMAATSPSSVVFTNAYTCMLGGNEETFNQLIAVGKNANIAGVLVLAMGCGSIQTSQIVDPLKETGKPVYEIICQDVGGSRKTIEMGIKILSEMEGYINTLKREEFPLSKLIIGVKCGGSDTSSGMASNPAVGLAVDKLVDMDAICIGGELFELQGCSSNLNRRAVSETIANKIDTLIENERKRWSVEGIDMETMSIGNCVGGLTTIEEKSLGALHKMGTKPIQDILQINKDFVDKPNKPGFYLSETTMLCGGSAVNFASFGTHIILWTSGGAGFNNAIVPVIRVSGNKDLYNEDMDVSAIGIMDGSCGTESVADVIIDKISQIASGEKTAIEDIASATMTLYQKDQRLEKLLNVKRCQ